jgi:hypothetical protein
VRRIRSDWTSAYSPSPVGVSASGTVVYTDDRGRLLANRRKLLDHVPEMVTVAGETAYAVQQLPTSPFRYLERLVAVDLVSGAVTPLTVALESTQFHTDGTRLLYSRFGGCVLYGDLPAAAPETTPAGARCGRQTLSFDVAEVHKRPRVRMWVTCPGGSAERCTGTARLTARGRTLGRWRFSVPGGTGATHAIKVKLRRGKRRQVARLRVTGTPTRPFARRIVFLR